MSFVKRAITVVFTLGTGNFGETGSNQVTVTGLRISAKILKTGAAAMSECQLRIFGLTPTIYNALTAIYPITQALRRNQITVLAGDDVSGMAVVFIGQIIMAQIDLNSPPDSVLNVIAQTGLLQAVKPIPPTSYPKGASVASVMASLAIQMGLEFENNGVKAILPKSYFPGTARQQALACVEAAGIKWNGGDDGVLAIWNSGGHRGTFIPLISPDSGMIGYPAYSNIGLAVKTIYNPNVQYGGQIKVQSSIPQANGFWTVFGLSHSLESEMPHGQWSTDIQGFSLASANQS
jgi:hypothetical protein